MRVTDWAATPPCALMAILVIAGCSDRPSQPRQPQTATEVLPTIVSASGVNMVRLPAGEFTMGSDSGEDDEGPTHRVQVAPFYMDTHEVTQESYESLMGQNPAKFKNPQHPVEQIGWFGAIRYCNMRSLREGLTPCYDLNSMECNFEAEGYRLPTESEWEYACRAGTGTDYSFGADQQKLGLYGWFEGNAGQTTHPVGTKNPNPWGLYDMHGNVSEWCQDYYNEAFYHCRGASDKWNSTESAERVLRGGSWGNSNVQCRSSARHAQEPGLSDVCFGYDAYGFRCVRRCTG